MRARPVSPIIERERRMLRQLVSRQARERGEPDSFERLLERRRRVAPYRLDRLN